MAADLDERRSRRAGSLGAGRSGRDGGLEVLVVERGGASRVLPGYVAFPGGMMASLWNRPLALHEQNAIPGLANKVLAQVSDKVMAGFPQAL